MQRKSRKRKAAELKAARRASSSQLNENTRGEWIGHVNSSDNDGSSSSFTTTVCSVERDWTRQCMHVDVPARVDWSAIFSDSRYFSNTARELDVLVVEHDVAKGLEWLNQGARDSVVAIDLEWRPDSKYTSNHVACIQLATTTRCLVVRCCRWRAKRQLPQVLVDFFRNPDNLFVRFSSLEIRYGEQGCGRGDIKSAWGTNCKGCPASQTRTSISWIQKSNNSCMFISKLVYAPGSISSQSLTGSYCW